MAKRILMLAGEASGDMYGAALARALKEKKPDLLLSGMGSQAMRAAGVDLLIDASTVSVVGATEVITHLPAIFRAIKRLKHFLKTEKPQLLILIDFPDFNFHIGKFAKKLGIPVAYYISPQVWAWRKNRIHDLKKFVDLMLVILPFEAPFYRKHQIPVCYEGHPLVDWVHSPLSKPDFCEKYHLSEDKPIIGILPGSRHSELKRLLPILVQTAEKCQETYPDAQFVLPLAPTLLADDLKPYLTQSKVRIQIIDSHRYAVIHACDLTLSASGTVTLETALLNTPQIILYRLGRLSYWIGKALIRVPFFGLCNLIAGKAIVPELLQDDANPERLHACVQSILNDPKKQAQIREDYQALRTQLGEQQVTDRLASTLITHFFSTP